MPNKDQPIDELPSYAESIGITQAPYSPSLPRDLTTARTSLVSSLLDKYLAPHVQTNVLYGLSSSTLVLVPSNVIDLQPPTASSKEATNPELTIPGEKLVGFPHVGSLRLLRLHESENSVEFWRQPAVLHSLEQQLGVYLRQKGYRVTERSDRRRTEPGYIGSSSSERSTDKEWKTIESPLLREGEVRVGAEIKEICLRIENAMGLYETRTGKALVVKVEVGG